MEQLFIGVAIAVIVGGISLVLRSKRNTDPPTQPRYSVPTQIDRSDFGSPTEEWLIVVFTSSTCAVCADVSAKVDALTSRNVATRSVEYSSQKSLHDRYGIDAVPAVVIADSRGEVRHHVLGPISATDLWAAVAAVRGGEEPGANPCSEH